MSETLFTKVDYDVDTLLKLMKMGTIGLPHIQRRFELRDSAFGATNSSCGLVEAFVVRSIEVYCDESRQDLVSTFCKRQSGYRVIGDAVWVEADTRSDVKTAIASRVSPQLRRTVAVLAALLLFSFLSVLGQQQTCAALAAAIGTTIEVSGVVDSPVTRDAAGQWAWFYISGSGCRIRVYYGGGNVSSLDEGSRVLIEGRRSEFNNEAQITAESVDLMEPRTASTNRLLLIILVVCGLCLSALGVMAVRRRHRRTSDQEMPPSSRDGEPVGDDLSSAESQANLDSAEDDKAKSIPAQDSGQVVRGHLRAYDRWSTEEDESLLRMKRAGNSVDQISKAFERRPGAIRSRLKKLDKGKAPKHSPSHTQNNVRPSNINRANALRSGEIEFMPLAVSSMSADAVCVAGLDVRTQSWVRLVRRGMYSLNEAESAVFRDRSIMAVQVGAHQVRPHRLDPRQLHTEDRLITGKPRKLRSLNPEERFTLLTSAVDEDLARSLLTERSLYLVEPTEFHLIPRDGKKPKMAFETPTTSTDALRSDQRLEGNLIGISSQGCPCNCLVWDQASNALGKAKERADILNSCPGATVFLALSLTGLPTDFLPERQKHYLLVAGIHVIGRDRVWL